MIDITAVLEEIKSSPYRDITVVAPHSGTVRFGGHKAGDSVMGTHGQFKEQPGTTIAQIERERNPQSIHAPEKGRLSTVHSELEGKFVEAGTPLAVIRHWLTRAEVQDIILKNALYLFCAPERAKYYFTPEVDKKIRAADSASVTVRDGMDLMIMSRMKRETPLRYMGPEGVIYAVYFKYNENVDAGVPLIGVSPPDQLSAIQDVIMRVQTEWQEKD